MGDVVRRHRHCIARTDRQQSLGRQDAIPVQRIRARRWQPGTPRRSPQFGSPQHDVGCDGCVVERGLDLVKTSDTVSLMTLIFQQFDNVLLMPA